MKTALIAASVVALLTLPALAQGTPSPASTTNKAQGMQGATGQSMQDTAGSSTEMAAPRKMKAKHAKKRKHGAASKSSM